MKLDGCRGYTAYRLLACLMLTVMFPLVASADQLLVPGEYATIQSAIDAAEDGDEIIVQPNVYYENLQMPGAGIILRSTDPLNPAVVSTTIIDGQRAGRVVTFDGSETQTCVLAGFTIRNGLGGIDGRGTQATIERNIIVGNAAPSSGGPTITYGGSGGGILNCDGLIQYNTIQFNYANGGTHGAGSGGGLSGCDGVIQNNLIRDNEANRGARYYATSSGGGLASCRGMIINNIIAFNHVDDIPEFGYTGSGGGASGCGTIIHCTIFGNDRHGVSGADHVINSILWGNGEISIGLGKVENSCIDNIYYLTPENPGNVVCDPQLVNPDLNDFSLQSNSICIDGGRFVSETSIDYHGQPRPVIATPYGIGDGAGFDMGAIETQMPVLNPTPFPDRSGVVEFPNEFMPTIQSAIHFVNDGATIIIQPGTYSENLKWWGKNIRLSSTNPLDPAVVEATVIDGLRHDSVIEFDGTEPPTAVLEGLTIQNGYALYGGGIRGNQTHATIRFNRIVNNTSYGRYNTITKTVVEGLGGGLYKCDGLIEHNLIAANLAVGSNGAGIGGSEGVVQNNLILENNTNYYDSNLPYGGQGGGMRDVKYCHNNTIIGNNAVWGGAGSNVEVVRNCIIWHNTQVEQPQQVIHNWPEVYDVAWSCVQDWSKGGEGILTVTPGFVDPQSGGSWRLQSDSPCIDAGIALAGIVSDLEGTPRPLVVLAQPSGDGSGMDLGAYEFVSASESIIRDVIIGRWPLTEGLRMVCDFNDDQKVTVADLILFLSGAPLPGAP